MSHPNSHRHENIKSHTNKTNLKEAGYEDMDLMWFREGNVHWVHEDVMNLAIPPNVGNLQRARAGV
jgi:hypothetical protein